MDPRVASAVRRSAILAAALVTTLFAHLVSGGGFVILPVAPLLWMNILSLALIAGPRRGATTFTARGPFVMLLLLMGAQLGMHLAMNAAPWAFGLMEHHSTGLITTTALAAHGAAAVVLSALLSWGERLLAAAVAVANAILGALQPPRPAAARPAFRVPFSPLVVATHSACAPRSSRGPPAR